MVLVCPIWALTDTVQCRGNAKVSAGITVLRSWTRTASGTLRATVCRDVLDGLRCHCCAIQSQCQTTHGHIARRRAEANRQCPLSSWILTPVVNRHKWPVVISLLIDKVIVAIWEQNRLCALWRRECDSDVTTTGM